MNKSNNDKDPIPVHWKIPREEVPLVFVIIVMVIVVVVLYLIFR